MAHPRRAQPGRRRRHRDRGRRPRTRAAAPTTSWSADNFITRSGYVGIATGGYCDGHGRLRRRADGPSVRQLLPAQHPVRQQPVRRRFPGDPGAVPLHPHGDPWQRRTRDRAGARAGGNRSAGTTGHLEHGTAASTATSTSPRGARAGPRSGCSASAYTGWQTYRTATGQDAHSRFADPRLRHPARGDLHLRAGSPAIDAGLAVRPRWVGTRDIDGQRRVQGARIDIGADERGGAVP